MAYDLTRDEKVEIFDQIVESTPHHIWMFSADWDELIFRSAGYEELWGLSRERLEEDPTDFLSAVHPDDRDAVRRAMARVSAGEPAEVEYRVTAGEDRLRWVHSHGKPIRDETGEIVRIAGYTRDTTDSKRKERELKRQNERLEEFASIVSHDLRNPLSVAEGRLRLAQTECDSAHLDDVAAAHERMNALIDDLLTLAREGEPVDSMETIDLGEVTASCWGNVATHEAALVIDTARTIWAHESRLRQLLENLIRNAVEHGPDDVTVTVGDLDGGFYVEDDGPGIPEPEREQIFERGYSTTETGTGYGLAIVAEIAETYEWEVSATESPTGGTRFEITGVNVASP